MACNRPRRRGLLRGTGRLAPGGGGGRPWARHGSRLHVGTFHPCILSRAARRVNWSFGLGPGGKRTNPSGQGADLRGGALAVAARALRRHGLRLNAGPRGGFNASRWRRRPTAGWPGSGAGAAGRWRCRRGCRRRIPPGSPRPAAVRQSRPAAQMALIMGCTISGSIAAITCPPRSTRVTPMPRRCRFSATSRPMKPPPTTTACLTPCAAIQDARSPDGSGGAGGFAFP